MKRHIIFVCMLLASGTIACWSKTYKIVLQDVVGNNVLKLKEKVGWHRRALPAFSQLIFSWHAVRPKKGVFTFWVQVRDKKTKKWYSWHKVAQWGSDKEGNRIQRSFENKCAQDVRFSYVRLDMPNKQYADGFRVRVQGSGGAVMEGLKSLIVNTSRITRFKTEIGMPFLEELSSVRVQGLPKYSQMVVDHPNFDSLCSPTSVCMVLGFFLKTDIDPKGIAEGVFDYGLGIYGSWPFNVAYAFECSNQRVRLHVERLRSFKQVHASLKHDNPVIVSVRGPLDGGATPYAGGHLLVIIGYNHKNKKIICHDPAFDTNEQVLVEYDRDKFIRAWERSYRLAYIAS